MHTGEPKAAVSTPPVYVPPVVAGEGGDVRLWMLAGVHGGCSWGGAGTASLGMGLQGGMPYAQQPAQPLAMLHPALPELSTLIAQFEAAAISNANGVATPALLMQACPSAPLCWVHGLRILTQGPDTHWSTADRRAHLVNSPRVGCR